MTRLTATRQKKTNFLEVQVTSGRVPFQTGRVRPEVASGNMIFSAKREPFGRFRQRVAKIDALGLGAMIFGVFAGGHAE